MQPAHAIIASFMCLGCVLFLIAATVVLALIPIYTPQQAATYNPNAHNSKIADIVASIDKTSSQSSGKRKRDIANETTLYSAFADSDGRDQIKAYLSKILPSYVKDIAITSVTVIPRPSSLLSKRQISKREDFSSIALRIMFYIVYQDSCLLTCQLNNAGPLKSIFENYSYSQIVIPTFYVTLTNGVRKTLYLRLGSARKVSDIIPGLSSGIVDFVGDDPATTAASTTANVGG